MAATVVMLFPARCAFARDPKGPPDPGETPARRVDTKTEHRLVWTYPRVRLWQIVTSAALSGTNLYLESVRKSYDERRWTNGILFDDAIRDSWRADTKQGRADADAWSDIFWHPVQYYPVFIDSLLVPLATDDGNVDVAAQMTLINWQAIALSFFLIRGGHYVIGRARPSLQGCSNDPNATNVCSKRGSAFPSGHTGMAATGAGLSCAHHQALPLYGGGWVEAVPCVALSAAAWANGVFRIIADRHWATDIIVGYAIGFASGYGIPYLLHYGAGGTGGRQGPNVLGLFRSDLLPARTVIIPMLREGAWGLTLAGSR